MNKQKGKETDEMTCPSCGFRAKSADEMQAHMRETENDPAHTVRAGVSDINAIE